MGDVLGWSSEREGVGRCVFKTFSGDGGEVCTGPAWIEFDATDDEKDAFGERIGEIVGEDFGVVHRGAKLHGHFLQKLGVVLDFVLVGGGSNLEAVAEDVGAKSLCVGTQFLEWEKEWVDGCVTEDFVRLKFAESSSDTSSVAELCVVTFVAVATAGGGALGTTLLDGREELTTGRLFGETDGRRRGDDFVNGFLIEEGVTFCPEVERDGDDGTGNGGAASAKQLVACLGRGGSVAEEDVQSLLRGVITRERVARKPEIGCVVVATIGLAAFEDHEEVGKEAIVGEFGIAFFAEVVLVPVGSAP